MNKSVWLICFCDTPAVITEVHLDLGTKMPEICFTREDAEALARWHAKHDGGRSCEVMIVPSQDESQTERYIGVDRTGGGPAWFAVQHTLDTVKSVEESGTRMSYASEE